MPARPPARPPVTVAIVNDYELVVAGLAAVLGRYRDRVALVDVSAGEVSDSAADVVLYDTFAQVGGRGPELESLVTSGGKVVVFSLSTRSDVVEQMLARGAAGYVPKWWNADRLVTAIEQVHAGHTVRPRGEEPEAETDTATATGDWPGRANGLTPRESEVLGLVARGLSNQEVAEATYLSINSIKTHIRAAYRKIGVTSRSQAVLWAVDHGLRARSEG